MPTAEDMLNLARERRRGGDPTGAYEALRQALFPETGAYEHVSKAAELFARLRKESPPPGVRHACKVAYLGSTTVVFHLPILALVAWTEGVLIETYAPPYGTLRQEVLNPDSKLYEFAPDVVIIASNWRDMRLPALGDNPESGVQALLDPFRQQWDILLRNRPCRIIQHNLDLPAWDSAGALGARLSGGRTAMLREFNRELALQAPPQVAVLDQDGVSANFGRARWQDDRTWHLAKQHPAHAALPDLARAQVALLRAGLGLTRKVLVLDLDNTLWGGVIGEDGLAGIQLGPPDARGEAHQELQRHCRELKERGILLAVCSKNNEEDARLPFEQHDASVLKLDDFADFVANWNDKAANLEQMAKRLNLGLDSFVLLDDNPVERSRVRARLPMVAVPEIGSDPSDFVAALARGRYFEAWDLSREDRQRADSYAANARREKLASGIATEDDYLRELDMVCTHGPFDEATLPRIAQLVGKTNQFNLTTRRHSLEELRRFAADPGHWTRWFRLRDRFGDFGLIGALIAAADGAGVWRVDTLLMSCRVMGRGMETFMMQTLLKEARSRNIEKIVGVYRPTPKNPMVADFFPKLNFKIASTGAEETRHELPLTEAPVLTTWIQDSP